MGHGRQLLDAPGRVRGVAFTQNRMIETTRIEAMAGWVFLLAGVLLAVGSVLAVGEAQSWDVADAFAADSMRPGRRIGMLMGALGLAALVAATPGLVARVSGTPGSSWVTVAWAGFAAGTVLFAMALGLAAILMPALGELAETGAVSPQEVADRLTHQGPLVAAFLGGNIVYLSWLAMGAGIVRSGLFPPWLGWLVAITAAAAWLGFLHVPIFQRVGAVAWSLAIAVVGLFLL